MTTTVSSATLGQYGKYFQECVMQSMLTDQRWAEQLIEVFDTNYFELKYLTFLSERYFSYAKKYKVFPTLPLLLTIIKDELRTSSDNALKEQVVDYLQRMRLSTDMGDLPYVKEKTLDFARKQALKGALEEAVDQIQAEKYESIVDNIKRAVSVGTTTSLGHDFFSDYEARFVSLKRSCIPIGIDELDCNGILNGGMGKGELSCVIGGTGAGKSHFLVYTGANAVRMGLNVLHFTFELSETAVGVRYDSNFCAIDSNDVIDHKEDVIKHYSENKYGRLIIKEYPTNTATVHTIRNHIERLSLKGFIPDLVIIDYADIMRSTRKFDSLRHELKLVYEELRGLAMEKMIPILTASQSNKEGSNAEIIDVSNMSEAYGKAFVADIILSISRKPHEKASGWGRLYVAKNRAGRDGIVFTVKINTARSLFEVVGAASTPEETKQDDVEEMKKALRNKWNELREDISQNGTNNSRLRSDDSDE